jgi:hypothetical protein
LSLSFFEHGHDGHDGDETEEVVVATAKVLRPCRVLLKTIVTTHSCHDRAQQSVCRRNVFPAPIPEPDECLMEWLLVHKSPIEHRKSDAPGFMLGALLLRDHSTHSGLEHGAIAPLLKWVQYFQNCKLTLTSIGIGTAARISNVISVALVLTNL